LVKFGQEAGMPLSVNRYDAKTQLSQLVERTAAGQASRPRPAERADRHRRRFRRAPARRPAGRMLVAQARHEGLTIVSACFRRPAVVRRYAVAVLR